MKYCTCRSMGRHSNNPPVEVRGPYADKGFQHTCTGCWLPRIKRAVRSEVVGPRPDLGPDDPAWVPPDPRDLHGTPVEIFNRAW